LEINQISGAIVDASMKIHSALGPGLLESVYEACLKHELIKRGFICLCQQPMPVIYDGVEIEMGFRLDLLVENTVIVELKAIERLLPIHEAQLLTYLKLTKKEVGLLINFNVTHLRNGIKRIINNQSSPRRIDIGISDAVLNQD
jgi:GxxExxY protein